MVDHLDELVIKAVGESGGYGMLMGPMAAKAMIEEFRTRLLLDPRNYIAQPLCPLSVCPVVRSRHPAGWPAGMSIYAPTVCSTERR